MTYRIYGQFVLYRVLFTLAGDLADSWSVFGGVGPHVDRLATVLPMSTTRRAGIALTYGYRLQRAIQKSAPMRPDLADFAAITDAVRKGAYDGALRDSESRTAGGAAIKKEVEKEKTAQAKTRPNKKKTNET